MFRSIIDYYSYANRYFTQNQYQIEATLISMLRQISEDDTILEVAIQSFRYAGSDRDSLKNVRLSVRRGETIVFLGDSGSGKSTLLRCIGGLCPYMIFGSLQGDIRFSFPDLSVTLDSSNRHGFYKRIGYLFQNPEVQLVNPIVLDELVFTLENQGIDRSEIQSRLDSVLAIFPVKHLLNQRVTRLSQGQKQLVAFISLITQQPDIYLLDEPTAMLDFDNTNSLVKYLDRLKIEQNPTILLTTHKKEIASEIGDRVLYLKDGQLASSNSGAETTARVNAPLPFRFTEEESMLELRDVTYWYTRSDLVLKDINLRFQRGELVWIAGPNGSGKSTLALIMSGLYHPRKGVVTFAGTNIKKRTDLYPGKIGLILQNPDHQIFNTTIREELEFGFQFLRNISERDRNQRMACAVERLRFLEDISTTDPRELSFGQKKILNLLSFLLAEPRVLILDEPDLALDRKHERVMMELIEERRASGTLIFVISHNVGLIQKYATRLVYIKNRVVYDGDPAKFLEIHHNHASL